MLATGLIVIWTRVSSHNLAAEAQVTASTQASADQGVRSAVDGVVGGYPGDHTKEWSSDSEGVGAWLELRWDRPQVINHIVLHDRPNDRDGILAAELTFDGGQAWWVGELPNDGASLKVTFGRRVASAVRVRVTKVRPTTANVGLAEVEVWGKPASGSTPSAPSTSAACAAGSILNVIAHPDDDLLFLSPTLFRGIETGKCVRTVVVTAGDNGQPATYWQRRELGLQAAYSQMAGVENEWTTADAGIPGRPAILTMLTARPEVSLVFLRLPDGNLAGQGYPQTGGRSLLGLWQDSLSRVSTVDSSSSYNRTELIDVLRELIVKANPKELRTLDIRDQQGDHSDHQQVGLFVTAGVTESRLAVVPRYYVGYGMSKRSANVSGKALAAKKRIFFTYARNDANTCASDRACRNRPEAAWFEREYTVPPDKPGR